MIRLSLLILFLLISLLAIFRAPQYHLWLLAIVVTEYPMVFAGIAALLTAWGYWVPKYQLAGTLTGILALIIFISPIIRAYIVADGLQREMAAGFNIDAVHEQSEVGKPFSFFKQFTSVKPVAYQTLTYVNYADTSLNLDFYPSQVPGNRPCVIVVHGGSWAGGDSKQLPELNSELAARGYHVASLNYRLAPKYQTPAPVEDVKAALAYLRKHADDLHIDSDQFVLLGRSAGAQIVLLVAYTLHDPSIKGVIDYYGPADMVWGYSIPSNPLIMDSRGVMDQYIGGSYAQAPQKYVACSPLEFVNKQSVPTLIIHGKNDVLVAYEHSRRLSQKLQQNGIPHYWLKLPWATHGFDYHLNGPGGQLATFAVETFLNTITK